MKDWKAAYQQLKGEMRRVEQENRYLKDAAETRASRDAGTIDRFKELLIEILGRRE